MLPPAKYHCFGDWLSIKADTPTDIIFMAYFANAHADGRLPPSLAATKTWAIPYAVEQIKAAFNKPTQARWPHQG